MCPEAEQNISNKDAQSHIWRLKGIMNGLLCLVVEEIWGIWSCCCYSENWFKTSQEGSKSINSNVTCSFSAKYCQYLIGVLKRKKCSHGRTYLWFNIFKSISWFIIPKNNKIKKKVKSGQRLTKTDHRPVSLRKKIDWAQQWTTTRSKCKQSPVSPLCKTLPVQIS